MNFFSSHLNTGSAALLVGAVLLVGILHTIVPDHWVPITLIARQRGWTRGQTARAALLAGTGHVVTTLILAGIVWLAGWRRRRSKVRSLGRYDFEPRARCVRAMDSHLVLV